MNPHEPQVEPVPGYTEQQLHWIDAQLISTLIHSDRQGHRVVFVVITTLVCMLYPVADAWPLGLWAVCAVLMALLREYLIRHAPQGAQTPQAYHAYMRRYGWTWPASVLIVSSVAWLSLHASLVAQLGLCWIMLAGLSGYATTSFSAHRPTMYACASTSALVSISAMAYWSYTGGLAMNYGLILVALMYWQFSLFNGRRLHQRLRATHELQLRNQMLIESLTQQSERAARAMELKNRFLTGAAHDIRQPVHALRLYADMLADDPQLGADIAPKIVESTRAVNTLFDSLLDFARLESGNLEVRVEAVSVKGLLRELELQYRPLAQAKGLQLRLRCMDAQVQSDPVLLRRILGNLLDNAIKYTASGGVVLAARRRANALALEVRDTGQGIAQEHQDKIFQEFYKVPLHGGTTDGFGLGLAIVARLSTLLGYPLHLVSRTGKGARFWLSVRDYTRSGLPVPQPN